MCFYMFLCVFMWFYVAPQFTSNLLYGQIPKFLKMKMSIQCSKDMACFESTDFTEKVQT